MQEYTGAKDSIWTVLYLPGAPPRLAATTMHSLFLWRLGQPEPLAEFPWQLAPNEDGRSALVACSPDGRWLIGATTRTVQIWDLTTEVPRPHTSIEIEHLLAVQFAPSSEEILVVQRKPEFGVMRGPTTGRRAFTFDTLKPFAPFPDSERRFDHDYLLLWLRDTMAFSPDGRLFTGSTGNQKTPLWDVHTQACLGHVRLRRAPTRLLFSNDGSLLALDAGTTVYIYDTQSMERVSSWKTNYSYSPSLAWSPDNRMLARTDSSTTLRLYEVHTGREVAALSNKRGRNTAVSFSLDGLTCAVGLFNGAIRVWDVG